MVSLAVYINGNKIYTIKLIYKIVEINSHDASQIITINFVLKIGSPHYSPRLALIFVGTV